MKNKLIFLLVIIFVSVFSFVVYAEDSVIITDLTIEELTLLTENQETTVSQLISELENTELTDEERLQKETDLALLQIQLESNFEKLADLLTENDPETLALTKEEKLALEEKATELEGKIAELEAILGNQENEVTEAEKLALEEELVKLQNDLKDLQATLEAAGSDHPNFLRFQNAERLGITPGKMHLLEKIQQINGEKEIEFEVWAGKTVKEINMAVKEERMNQKFEKKSSTPDSVKVSASKSKGNSGSKSKK